MNEKATEPNVVADRWQGRPVLAALVRFVSYALPMVAAVVASVVLGRILPPPSSAWQLMGWWAILIGLSTAVLFGVDRLTKRLLPIAALLGLTMIFPDRAPSRFRTALRVNASTSNLQAQIAEAEALGRGDDLGHASEVILRLASALSEHDRRTRGHSERVRAYADLLGEEMGLSDVDRGKLRWAALLHDIGKLRISRDILNKPGALDDSEWAEIQRHPQYGMELAAPILEWLGDWAGAIGDHHERFDGSGYPLQKSAEDISLGGRICSVVDAYDVMTSARSYKKPMPSAAAREELARHAGAQFDPEVVRAFLRVGLGKLRWIAGPLSWLAHLPFLRVVGAVQQVSTSVGLASVAATATIAMAAGGIIDVPLSPSGELADVATTTTVVVEATTTTVTTLPPVNARDVVVELVTEPAVAVDYEFLDSSDQGAGFTVGITDNPGEGSVILSDGVLTYVPSPDFVGEDSLEVTLYRRDGQATVRYTVLVTVVPPNAPPDAYDDEARTDEDTAVTIDVLDNDDDPDGNLDPASLTIVSQPAHGSAAVVDGKVAYVPEPEWAGTATLRYRIEDAEGLADTAAVEIEVRPVNDPPVALADFATVDAGATVSINVLGNDHDPDGDLDPASLAIVGAAASGTSTVIEGGLAYTPSDGFVGSDTVRYEICDDGGACAQASVGITVGEINQPPIASPDAAFTAEEISVDVAVLANDSDPDGDPVTLTAAATTSTLGGSVSCAGSACTYAPPLFDTTEEGEVADGFTYGISDGRGGTATGTVTVTVTVTADVAGANTAPEAVADAATVPEDGSVSFDVLANDGDADGDTLVVTSYVDSAEHGTVVDLGGGSFSYQPDPDFVGADDFSYTVEDGQGGSDTATVVITVSPVNDPPSFGSGGRVTVDEDSGAYVGVWATAISAGPADESGQTVSFAVLSVDDPDLFSAGPTLTSDGTLSFTPAPDASGSTTVKVEATDDGGTLDGGIDTSAPVWFTIRITATNDAPEFVAGADVTVTEDSGGYSENWATGISPGPPSESAQAVSLEVVANDEPALFSVQPSLDASGKLSFVTATDANGVATLVVEALDDGGVDNGGEDTSPPQIFTVTITPVNDAPSFTAGSDVIVAEDSGPYSAGWAGAISPGPADEAGQSVWFLVTGNSNPSLFAAGPTIGADGTLSFTPATDAAGSAAIELELTDDGGGADTSAPQIFTITVSWENDPPSFSGGGNVTVAEDSGSYASVWATGISAGSGEAGQSLTFAITSNTNPTLFSSPPAIAPHGVLTFTPAADAVGSADVEVELSDDGGGAHTSPLQSFTISVTPVNDAPSFVAGGNLAVAEDSGLYVGTWASGVSVGPPDESGQTPSFVIVSNDNPGLFSTLPTLAANGTLSFWPAAGLSGTATIEAQLHDDGGTAGGGVDSSPIVSFDIEVTPLNDPPVAGDDPDGGDDPADFEVVWISDLLIPAVELLDNDTDPEGDSLEIAPSGPTATAHGSVTCDLTGCTYTPDGVFTGIDTFTYSATDGLLVGSATVSVTVVDYAASPLAGRLIINEIVYFDPGTVGAEAIEIFNAFGAPLDLTGVRVADGNLIAGDIDSTGPSEGPLDFTLPALDALGVPSLLPAGGYAVVFTGTQGGAVEAPAADLQYGAGMDGKYVIDNNGDDVWLLDGGARVIDYVVYGGEPGHEINVRPPPVLGWWDPAYELALISSDEVSISLTPNGVDGDAGACWEVTGSGEAGARPECVGVPATIDTDPAPAAVTSLGRNNNVDTNNPPVAVDDGPFPADEDTTGMLTSVPEWLANDWDPDTDPLTVSGLDTVTSQGGSVTHLGGGAYRYAPVPDFFGTDTFSYTITDGRGGYDTATITVEVAAVNDEPSFTPGGDVVRLEDSGVYASIWATDVAVGPSNEAAQTPAFEIVSNDHPALFALQPAVAAGGMLSFVPADDANGTAAVEVRLIDDGGTANGGDDASDPVSLQITITSVNDEPSFSAGGTVTVGQDSGAYSTAWATGISVGPPDEAGQVPSFEIVSVDNPGLFGTQPAVASDGTLSFEPAAGVSGSAVIEVRLVDDGGTANGGDDTSDPVPFTIIVTAANQAPVAIDDGAYGVIEDGSTVLTEAMWLGNDFDPDTDPLTVTAVDAVTSQGGTTLDLGGGSYLYAPAPEFYGLDDFTYTITDGNGGFDTAMVSVAVSPLNDPPSFTSGGNVVVVDGSGPYSAAWASDISMGPANESGQSGIFQITSNSNPGLFATQPAVAPDGTLSFEPAPGTGIALIEVELVDDGGGDDTSALESFSITVPAAGNNPPVANDDLQWGSNQSPTLLYPLANDFDPDGDPLDVLWVGTPTAQGGLVAVNPGGTVTYTAPSPGWTGIDSFAYTATDGRGGTDDAWVATLTVVSAVIDLEVRVAGVVPTPVDAGNPVVVTFEVENLGPDPATGVNFTSTLPAAVLYGDATSTLGTCTNDGQDVDCAIGDLAVGQVATVAVTATPLLGGTHAYPAGVVGDQPGNNPWNNNTAASVEVNGGAPSPPMAPAMATGEDHTCGVSLSGNVWCWGANPDGRLGDGTTTGSDVPTQVVGPGGAGILTGAVDIAAGRKHTCAVLQDGTVWCWGENAGGVLGIGSTSGQYDGPEQVVGPGGAGVLSGIVDVDAGEYHTCAAASDGAVYCWGKDDHDQLGTGGGGDSSIPVPVVGVGGFGTLSDIARVGAGRDSSCAVGVDGSLYCWGENNQGQLGDGTTNQRNEPVVIGLPAVVEVNSGDDHTCARRADGTAWCWGDGGDGELGNGGNSNSLVPVQVLGIDGSGLLGGVVSIGTGERHGCAALADGSAVCWGDDSQGQLGNGVPNTDSNVPRQVAGPGGVGVLGSLVAVSQGNGAEFHACAVGSDSSFWCWGEGAAGQLGNADTADSQHPVQAVPPVGADCGGPVLPGGDYHNCDMTGADLTGADLTGADLTGADLTGADLTGAILDGAKLKDVVADGADLSGASLVGVNDLNGSFVSTDLSGTDLSGSNFNGADLTSANLSDAVAIGTNFNGATADLAIWSRANLTNANLNSVTTAGAVWDLVTWANTICPDGTNSDFNGGTCIGHL